MEVVVEPIHKLFLYEQYLEPVPKNINVFLYFFILNLNIICRYFYIFYNCLYVYIFVVYYNRRLISKNLKLIIQLTHIYVLLYSYKVPIIIFCDILKRKH